MVELWSTFYVGQLVCPCNWVADGAYYHLFSKNYPKDSRIPCGPCFSDISGEIISYSRRYHWEPVWKNPLLLSFACFPTPELDNLKKFNPSCIYDSHSWRYRISFICNR